MPDSTIDVVAAFRARLMRREAQALKRVVAAYLHASAAIKKRTDSLLRQTELSDAKIVELNRLLTLQKQIQDELKKFSSTAATAIQSAKDDAVELATKQAAEIIGSFNRLPVAAIENLVAAFEPAAPLARLFDSLATDLSVAARNLLVSGVAQGLSTQAIARQIRDEFGIGLHRATVISRTEILKAYRSASSQNYRANRDVVKGWIWYASLGKRCCAMCSAMHGTRHTVDEDLVSHPQCRCVQIPTVDESLKIQSGDAWLSQQDDETQVAVLGIAGQKAWQSGAVKLSDFVGSGFHPQFGAIRFQRSLKSILGRDEATRFYKRAA